MRFDKTTAVDVINLGLSLQLEAIVAGIIQKSWWKSAKINSQSWNIHVWLTRFFSSQMHLIYPTDIQTVKPDILTYTEEDINLKKWSL